MFKVSDLPEALRHRIHDQDLIVFDGECVLCSGFFVLMLRIDRAARFQFVVAQSELGHALYEALGLPTDDYETNLVMVDGRIHTHLDAFASAMQAVGGIWWMLSLCRFLPSPLKRFLYFRIARNRYALFGRRDTCLLPDAQVRARFLPDGWIAG